ncbi:TetR/AcrR family transcriptional regulator [Demequina aestuarii]|uniref:TetR/AcrR family transcriptional regulator n=1 Tax=Demequina aestuarii TaxID=327095 RepID=UPI000780C1C3|nr:TetR/AcrR family transcriptional regulator [Demequina aestuarii]
MRSTETMSPAASRVLDAAEELFYSRGITAVGVDLVAERSGVTKRTLYNRFGSKDGLIAAYLSSRDERWRAEVMTAVESSGSPADAVTAPFTVLASQDRSSARGCAFINALAELPDADHPGRRIAMDEKAWLLDLFARLATDARCAEPPALARRLMLIHEGALATEPLSRGLLTDATELARSLVREAAQRA